jgi:hypothetical protein
MPDERNPTEIVQSHARIKSLKALFATGRSPHLAAQQFMRRGT